MGSASLSVVIPCRDEAANLPALMDRLYGSLTDRVRDLQVIVVDDGSTDATPNVVAGLRRRYASLDYLRLSRSFGKEAALLAGLREASGDLVAMMDGDLQHPPEVLAQMLRIQADTGADQVVGVRARSGEGRFRASFSTVYGWALARVSDVALPAGQGDFRVVTARVRDTVVSLSEVTRFNRGLFAWVGFPTVEVEYADARRQSGGSRWSPTALVGYGLDGLLSFSPRPLRFLVGLGAAIMGLFLLYVLVVAVRILLFGIETPGYATLIAAVFFVGGMQAFSAGILGEYLGRIFLEVKRRPSYVIMDRAGGPDLSS